MSNGKLKTGSILEITSAKEGLRFGKLKDLDDGKEYLIPPWGSYFVKRVVNRFKSERDHVNSVRPIKNFLINGLIYDTYFTTRFILATIYYYVMVRFIYYFKWFHNYYRNRFNKKTSMEYYW